MGRGKRARAAPGAATGRGRPARAAAEEEPEEPEELPTTQRLQITGIDDEPRAYEVVEEDQATDACTLQVSGPRAVWTLI